MTVVASHHEELDELRLRVAQLETALESRIVIEQAKGMLRERLGLPTEAAFELLRLAARSNRLKLHALASEVVASFSTPAAVVRELGRRPEFMSTPREQRIVPTKEFFRRVNDAITHNGHSPAGHPYVCECANPYCTEKVDVTREDIKVLHSLSGHYIVLPGHELPDVERVVHATDRYMIVVKTGDETPARQ